MAIPGRDTEPVNEDDHVAVGAVHAGGDDVRVARGEHGLPVVRGNIQPGMEVLAVGERILPGPEARSEPAGDPPDRRRCHGQGVASLDAVADGLEAAVDDAGRLLSMPKTVSGGPSALEEHRTKRAASEPPMARDFTIAGSRSMARLAAGSTTA